MSTIRFTTPNGSEGAILLAHAMRGLIDGAQRDPRLLPLAATMRGQDAIQTMRLIFTYARSAMRTKHDPPGVDTLQTVSKMLDDIEAKGQTQGDCAHRATLIAALLKASKLRAALCLISTAPYRALEHVFAGARVGDSYFWLDPQEFPAPFSHPAAVHSVILDV